jgi:hypothetical protein
MAAAGAVLRLAPFCALLLLGGASAQDLFIPGKPGRKFSKEYATDAQGFTIRRYTAPSDVLDDLAAGRRLHAIFNESLAVDTKGFPELCDSSIVQDTCKLFNGDPEGELANADSVVPSNVQGAVSATVEGIADFWESVGLPIPAKCMDLCHAVVSWLQQHDHVVPPKSDLGCAQDQRTGKHECDIDLSPPAVHHSGGSEEDELPTFDHDALDENNQDIPPEGLDEEDEDEDEEDDDDDVEYTMDEIAVEIAHMFRIWPEISTEIDIEEDLLDEEDKAEDKALRGSPETGRRLYGSGGSSFSSKIKRVEQKSIAYIATAVREFNRKGTKRHMDKWFGRSAYDHAASRNKVKKVLQSVNQMLSHVWYVYPGPQCSSNTYAYVYPHGYKCDNKADTKTRPCTKSRSGKFIFYMCQLTMRSPESVQIETLTHEGSHHATAFTDDVCMDNSNPCSQTAYGRSPCQRLASRNPTKALKNADCYYIQDITDV